MPYKAMFCVCVCAARRFPSVALVFILVYTAGVSQHTSFGSEVFIAHIRQSNLRSKQFLTSSLPGLTQVNDITFTLKIYPLLLKITSLLARTHTFPF